MKCTEPSSSLMHGRASTSMYCVQKTGLKLRHDYFAWSRSRRRFHLNVVFEDVYSKFCGGLPRNTQAITDAKHGIRKQLILLLII